MFTLWIIKLTTRPRYHSSPIISQLWLGSFILSLAAWCEKHNALEEKKKNKGFTSSRAARLLLSVIWKLTLIILSDGFLSLKYSPVFQQWLYCCIHKGTAAACLPPLIYGSSATVPMLLPHMVYHWHKGCSVSLLFLTALMSHRFWKKEKKKKMALWSVLIALAEPRASVR